MNCEGVGGGIKKEKEKERKKGEKKNSWKVEETGVLIDFDWRSVPIKCLSHYYCMPFILIKV